ncbi:MAG: hypothetical protein QMD71_10070, partial [bacterium]|nr:hypothetical protein [bacterium]
MSLIPGLKSEYPATAISRALGLSRSGVYYLLDKGDKVTDKLERIRQKYGHLKLKFDSLCREFPKYGYRRIRVMLRRREGIYLSKKTVQW